MKTYLKSLLKSLPGMRLMLRRFREHRLSQRRKQFRLYLEKMTKEGTPKCFIKVGANDGLTDDPCGDIFLVNDNWRGLLIEPVPSCLERLSSIYSDQSRFSVEGLAVGPEPATANFYYVSDRALEEMPDLPTWYDQLGSFDRHHIVNHLDGRLEPFILSTEVAVETLQSIVERHGIDQIDFLHIDTEGSDLAVLQSLNLKKHRPRAIYIEHKHLSAEDRKLMISLLESSSYHVSDTGGDYFAHLINA